LGIFLTRGTEKYTVRGINDMDYGTNKHIEVIIDGGV